MNLGHLYYGLHPNSDPLLDANLPSDQHHMAVLIAMRTRCEYEGLRKALTQKYCSYYTTLLDNGELDELFPRIKVLREQAQELIDKKDIPDWFLVTVNADYLRKSFQELKTSVEKLVSKRWVVEYHYSFEQRGKVEADIGKGYHAHILLKRASEKTKWSEIVREIKSTASKVCDSSNNEILNIRKLWEKSDVVNAYNYVRGQKDTTGVKAYKAEALQYDSLWRQRENIQELYENVLFSVQDDE